MKRLLALAVTASVWISGHAASVPPQPAVAGVRIVPVLIRVDSSGAVTDVQPAYSLSPRLSRLLKKSLDAMITKPATVKGHPVDSQVVVNLALHTTPKPDSRYQFEARFDYVSMLRVPHGKWFWLHTHNNRLALVDDGPSRTHGYPGQYSRQRQPWGQDWNRYPGSPAQNAGYGIPTPTPSSRPAFHAPPRAFRGR